MQIYALHMESHQQRMGILSRYVETTNYSLGEDADGTERDLWSSNKFKWDNKGEYEYEYIKLFREAFKKKTTKHMEFSICWLTPPPPPTNIWKILS